MTQKNSILIVDDIQSNLILLNKILSDEGYRVISATNGDDAIRFAQENNFDLILLDVMMPKKDGFTVFEELKSNEKTAGIPVIFITVINNDTDTLKAFEMGAVDYISKPYSPTELRIRIKTQIALINAQKKSVSSHDKDGELNPLNDIEMKFKLIKNNILDLKHNQFTTEEHTKLEKQAAEILSLLQNLSK